VIALLKNRELLIAVAKEAHEKLTIPSELGDFVVSKQSLKSDFDGIIPNAKQGSSDGSTTGATRPKRSRGK
jgi:hypothetical protein